MFVLTDCIRFYTQPLSEKLLHDRIKNWSENKTKNIHFATLNIVIHLKYTSFESSLSEAMFPIWTITWYPAFQTEADT